VGALISEGHMNKVLSYIAQGRAEGARVLIGGERLTAGNLAKGYFVSPTIFDECRDDMSIVQEEIFGPVVTLQPFDSEAEALQLANASHYGLAACIWTQDISVAHRLAANIQSGICWVNCWLVRDLRTPFGGMKNSGVGREGGWEALRFFTETKNICIQL
jgi:aminomuconate-semialdehyde/2-hydroxymuconate-6-semialdehyde dehydrogenase